MGDGTREGSSGDFRRTLTLEFADRDGLHGFHDLADAADAGK
jgi:hypothetical protein